jgi:hypothetical protein
VRIKKSKLIVVLFLLALPAFGQSNPADPLDSSYLPSIDQNAADYPANVWVTSALAKVHQDSATPGNVKWAQLSAARNEFESFQVHEQAGSSTINLNVIISDLVNARTGTHITSASNIIVYREAYVNIVTLSDANGSTGYTPDILIPAVDPYRKQVRNAFPFTIAAHQTQSIWFDVFVPPTAPSGYYQGTVTITNGGTTYATLPVVLAVWNFSLPSTATLTSFYGNDSACFGYYGSYNCAPYPGSGAYGDPGDTGVALSDVDLAVMLLDHRVTAGMAGDVDPNTPPNIWTNWDSRMAPLLNGTPANTTTILSGAAMTELVYLSGSNNIGTPGNLQDWMTHFVSNGWQSKLLAWSRDEPGNDCSNWASINTNGPIYHGTTPPYPTFVTSGIANATSCGGLSNVDILVVGVDFMDPQGGSNQRSTYNTWLSGKSGRQVWLYEACGSNGRCANYSPGNSTYSWPSLQIDSTPVRNRIMQWIEYLNNVSGDLYYDTTYCWRYSCDDGNHNTGNDPWVYIYAFGGNGDGTLTYPGTTAKIGGTVPIPLPSMRLKSIRDGMQDYEYLHALTVAGQGSFAMSEVQSFITNAYTFNNDPTALLGARTALGNKLHQLSLTPPPQPPTGVTVIQVK